MSSEIEWFGQTLDSNLTHVQLFGLADYHLGNPFSDRKSWLRAIDYISKTKEAFGILVGDLCECVVMGSKGDIFNQVMTPQDQRDAIIEDLKGIKDKLLGSTEGNHERRIADRTGIDICQDIANALDIPYARDGLFLRISFGSGADRHAEDQFKYWVYATHGYGGARTRAAKAVKVERQADFVMADVVMMAHDHEGNLAPKNVLLPDEYHGRKNGKWIIGKTKNKRTLLVKCASHVRWGGYSQAGGFGISDLTMPTVLLGGSEKPWPMPNPSRVNQCEVRGIL